MSKRVLMIIGLYYPYNAPGHHRCAKLAKYLPRFGWEPTVLCGKSTKQNSGVCYDASLEGKDTCETIRVPYPYYRGRSPANLFDAYIMEKLATTSYPYFLYRSLLQAGRELLQNRHFDAIWATSPYTMGLKVAGKLSREFNTPWMADLRDLAHELTEKPGPLSRWQVRLETRACGNASALSTVSQPLVDTLVTRHSGAGYPLPVHLVPNGFDPEDYTQVDQPPSEFFDIVHCGLIYGRRSPLVLLDALDKLLAEGQELARLRVKFYGLEKAQLEQFVADRPCAPMVHDMGRVSFRGAQRILQRATVLLLLSHSGVRGMMTSKLFEYLAAGRMILSVPGDNDVTDAVLDETKAGVAGGNADGLAELLRGWYAEWKERGELAYSGLPEKIAQYSRVKQAERTAEILTSICL